MSRLTFLTSTLCAALTLAVAGCSPPATDEASTQLDTHKEETADALAHISAQLEGLDEKERRERLTELALAEGGTFTLYGVTSLEEMSENIDAFEEDTGLTVNYLRAGSEEILQRVLEEADADFRGADAVNENGAEMTYLSQQGLLAEVETPAAGDIPPEGIHSDWFWSYIDIFSPAWNTDLLSPSEAPKTWEDVLTKYEGQLLMEVGDIEWFATLVKSYFMEQQGMTEDEAVDIFREAAAGATFVDGHTLLVELISSGEYAVAATPYSHRVQEFRGDDAPVAWEPAVSPLVARPEGVGVHATAEHPASALLFVEWYLTDGQPLGKSQDRQPASAAVPGGGLPTQYDNLVVDTEAVIDEFDKWSDLYEEIVQLSGEPIEE